MIPIRTTQDVCEVSWFADLCGGDTARLSVTDPCRASTFEHCRNMVLVADQLGFKNILLPTSYTPGLEVIPFAAAVAPFLSQISLLAAIRTGEIHPPMLARHLATLDALLKGRLTVNIINSNLPGLNEDAELRYERCLEVVEILKQAWTQPQIEHRGRNYSFSMDTAAVRPFNRSLPPLLYFGGISNGSMEVCAKGCDVFLMWPDTEEGLIKSMSTMSAKAAAHNRTIDFGLRVHVIVRETEREARAWAKTLMSEFDALEAEKLKHRTQDSRSLGVLKQDELRIKADKDGYIEDVLWFDIGRARSGCAAAIVGDPEQVYLKLRRYMELGIRSFILSGYPLIEEAFHFGKSVLPQLPNVSLANFR